MKPTRRGFLGVVLGAFAVPTVLKGKPQEIAAPIDLNDCIEDTHSHVTVNGEDILEYPSLMITESSDSAPVATFATKAGLLKVGQPVTIKLNEILFSGHIQKVTTDIEFGFAKDYIAAIGWATPKPISVTINGYFDDKKLYKELIKKLNSKSLYQWQKQIPLNPPSLR